MSKRISAQSNDLAQKLLGKWAPFCIKRPQAVLTVLVLFSLAGYIAAYITWFPYTSPVSQLPKNFDNRLAWEETSRQTQFNSEIMLRISISDSDMPPSTEESIFSSHRRQKSKKNLVLVVDKLKRKLSGNRKHFCDVLSSFELQTAQKQELCELSNDDLQMLHAELLDARLVLGGQWSLLESANYAGWLTSRLQQSHDTLLQNRRLIGAAALFAEGLHQNLLRPSPMRPSELISPWHLNPDKLFAKTDSQAADSQSTVSDTQQNDSLHGTDSQIAVNETVIVWVKLAEPQLSGLLDRRVIGKTKKIDYNLLKKLDASMSELNRIIADVTREHADITIEPFGVPVDVQHSRSLTPISQLAGLPIVFAVLMLFLIAGIRHVRVYMAVFLTTICSFGVYLGFAAIWFEMITPHVLFIGIAVPLFGVCAGIIQAFGYLAARNRGYSASEAIVEMVQTSGRSVFRGGIISLSVFLLGVFYLWYFPYEPTALTLSFRSSLTGINLALFLLTQAVLACLCGSLGVLPALIRLLVPEGRSVPVYRSAVSARSAFDLFKTVPTIPQAVNIGLTVVLFCCCLYVVSRPKSPDKASDPFFTRSEKQAAVMPILVSQQVYEQYKQYEQNGRQDMSGLFACDASGMLAGYDATKAVLIDNMLRIIDHTSEQQKITLPDQNTLQKSLVDLYQQLAHQYDALQKTDTSDNTSAESVRSALRHCRQAAEQIAAICRLLPQLSPAEYYEKLDAYQQAVAGDLVIQQKRLQTRLYHNSLHRNDASPIITRRFLTTEQQPIVWLFPSESRQSPAQREQLRRFFAPILFGETSHDTTRENSVSRAQCGGFSLLVLSGRQLMQQQLPSLGAVILAAVLLPILIVHRSVPVGVMTILVVTGGLSSYGLLLTLLGIPFDHITVFPAVFFPLVMPLFLDMFRQKSTSSDHFKADISTILVCFGVGIVVVGYLMLSRDAAVFTTGRVMILGWTALMFPLLINLISVLKPEIPAMKKNKQQLNQAKFCEWQPETQQSETTGYSACDSITPQYMVPPQTHADVDKNNNFHPPEQPASLTTHDQLDFYRERIEATQVFEKHDITSNEKYEPAHDKTMSLDNNASVTQTDIAESPAFPSVWSIGTKHRPAQTVVVELHTSPVDSPHKTAVSLAPRPAGKATGKISVVGKMRVTAQGPQPASTSMPPLETHSRDDSPTILSIRRDTTDDVVVHERTTKKQVV